jgi:spiro-SPASM protein
MKALAVLFGGRLDAYSLTPSFRGRSALACAAEQARSFPGVQAVVLLAPADLPLPADVPELAVLSSPRWDVRSLLDALAAQSRGYDAVYYAWADCPLLDPTLAAAVMERHLRYAAEYSYADGWPYGFSPELLSPGTASVLRGLAGDDGGPVERDTLFTVLQKDINSFDIETVLSPQDLRNHRLTLASDCKRNVLLLERLYGAGLRTAADAESIIRTKPGLLRTLPSFFSIQTSGACPQSCSLCPYPKMPLPAGARSVLERRDCMTPDRFEVLLDTIVDFSGDGVIDLSLWGELSLHPQAQALAEAVLARPELALIIETSGIGWERRLLERLAESAAKAAPRSNHLAPLSWIVSLDADDPDRYREVRGEGYEEAKGCAAALLDLFPGNAYVQSLRIKGQEDDLERFYRSWKARTSHVIVQKHDHFCGFLPVLKAGDLSPIKRQPCWHLMRDLSILIDGTVPLCKEDVRGDRILGNAFEDPLPELWSRGQAVYAAHSEGEYPSLCAECDEYYTYNF